MNKYIFLILFILFFVKFKTIEKFTRDKLLYKCWDKKKLSTFDEFEKHSLTIKNKHGILNLTPLEYIDDIEYIPLIGKGMLLNNLCIDPDHRNKGYAIDLINKAIDKTLELKRNFIFVQIFSKNKKSLNLFTKKFNFSIKNDGIDINGDHFVEVIKILDNLY